MVLRKFSKEFQALKQPTSSETFDLKQKHFEIRKNYKTEYFLLSLLLLVVVVVVVLWLLQDWVLFIIIIIMCSSSSSSSSSSSMIVSLKQYNQNIFIFIIK